MSRSAESEKVVKTGDLVNLENWWHLKFSKIQKSEKSEKIKNFSKIQKSEKSEKIKKFSKNQKSKGKFFEIGENLKSADCAWFLLSREITLE